MTSKSHEYCHPNYTRKKKFRTHPSTAKCMLTIFWDYRGIIYMSTLSKV